MDKKIALFLLLLLMSAFYAGMPNAMSENESDSRGQGGKRHLNMLDLRGEWLPIPAPEYRSGSDVGSDERARAEFGVSFDVATKRVREVQADPSRIVGPLSMPSNGISSLEGIEPEAVFPPDDRVRITPTTSFPWSSICKLFITAADETQWIGSGFLVGSLDGHGYHVLTAGHCVYIHDHGGWASSIEVVPALDGYYAPYWHAWMTSARTYSGWVDSEMYEHDWALLTLDRNVGDYTGWMGIYSSNSSDPVYTESILHTAGYPADLDGGLGLYWDSDEGVAADEYNHWYRMDTYGGQSGSPVWYYNETDPYVLSIHAYGIVSERLNMGTRINGQKYSDLITWYGADSPPADYANLVDDGSDYYGFEPTEVVTGVSNFTVWSGTSNIGTNESGVFNISYYLSNDTEITPSDYPIGVEIVDSISSFNFSDVEWNGFLPNTVPNGTYWVGWIIDSADDVSELVDDGEADNVAYVDSYQVTVTSPPSEIVLDVTSGSVGTVVVMNGSGFDPYGQIDQGEAVLSQMGFLSNCSIVDAPVDVDVYGNFSLEFIVPFVPSIGLYEVNVTDGSGNYAGCVFNVTGLSSIELSPVYGVPGTMVSIQGWNFTKISDTDVQLELVKENSQWDLGTFHTDSTGFFEGTFIVPAVSFDVYTVNASTPEHLIHAQEDFLVNLFVVIPVPSYGPPGTNVTLSGTGFTPDGEWNATFGDTPIFEDEYVDMSGNINGWFLVPELEAGLYTISVMDVETGIIVEADFRIPDVPRIVVRGNNDRLYYNVYEDEAWSGWVPLPGSTIDRSAGAVLGGDLHLVVRGKTGGLYHGWVDLNTSVFSGWVRLSGDTPSAPVLTSSSDRLYLVVRGNNDGIYYREWDGAWDAWRSVPGRTVEAPGATVMYDSLRLVVVGTNGRLYVGDVLLENYAFSGWTAISGSTPDAPVLVDDEMSVYLVVRGNNNRVYVCEFNVSGQGEWVGLPGSTSMSPGAGIVGGELHVVVKGQTGGLYHGWMDLDSDEFSGWTRMSGDTPSPPTLTGN